MSELAPATAGRSAGAAGTSSRRVIFAAMLGNATIAVAKFVAAALTGSSAMLAEAIHSTVDTGDGVLLHVGLQSSQRPATREHPLGHGKDAFFFTLLVAMVVFGAGAGVSVYEGIHRLVHPRPLGDPLASYIVLGVSAVCEGLSFRVALREFQGYRRRTLRGLELGEALLAAKDPSMYAVLLEDAAALLGIAVAAAGIVLARSTGVEAFDGIASIVIGAILAAVAIFLARQSRLLLLGTSALPWVTRAVAEVVGASPDVEAQHGVQTVQLGVRSVMVILRVRFRPDLDTGALERAWARLVRDLRARLPEVRRVVLDLDPVTQAAPGPAPD